MNNLSQERLYQLLPAVHRIRDAEQGEVLRALLGVIEEELQRLEADIGGLYDNWFIETCDEWVVPYIGDLLSVRGLFSVQGAPFSQRTLVANTLAFRRRKGTAAVLERLARAVTGWPAVAVEFFELLAATQYLNHVRSGKGGTVDLRAMDQLELLNGPFEQSAHLAEIRHIDNGRGKYNIPQVGLFLWRLEAYFIEQVTLRSVTTADDGRYYFSPLGHDMPLFNRPQTVTVISQRMAEENVPRRLRRRPLYEELEARRQALVDGKTPFGRYFGNEPVLDVHVGYLRMLSASDNAEKTQLVSQFKAEFELKKKKDLCTVLIVAVSTNATKEWVVAGYNDAGEFKTILIDDTNDELAIELKKAGEANRDKLITLVCLAASSARNSLESIIHNRDCVHRRGHH